MGNITVSPRLEQLSGKRSLESGYREESFCGKKFLEWNVYRAPVEYERNQAGLLKCAWNGGF